MGSGRPRFPASLPAPIGAIPRFRWSCSAPPPLSRRRSMSCAAVLPTTTSRRRSTPRCCSCACSDYSTVQPRLLESRSQPKAPEFFGLVGGSSAMTRTYATIEKICALQDQYPASRRERHGQGAHRPRAAWARPAALTSVRAAQLRDTRPRAPRTGLRSRARRVHRRQRAQEGPVRAG